MTVWKSNIRRPTPSTRRRPCDCVFSMVDLHRYQTGRLARRKPLKALAIFLRAGVIRAAAAVSKVSAARPRRPRGRTPLVCDSAQIMTSAPSMLTG